MNDKQFATSMESVRQNLTKSEERLHNKTYSNSQEVCIMDEEIVPEETENTNTNKKMAWQHRPPQ